MAGRRSPEDSRREIITWGSGHYRRQSWHKNHLLWNTGRSAVKGLEAQAVWWFMKRKEHREERHERGREHQRRRIIKM